MKTRAEYLKQGPVAVHNDTAFSGIAIFDADSEVVVNANFVGDKYSRMASTKIHYTKQGEPYFLKEGRRNYINDFIKVNTGC